MDYNQTLQKLHVLLQLADFGHIIMSSTCHHHIIIMSSRHNSFLLYCWFQDLNLFFFADASNFNSYRNIKHVPHHHVINVSSSCHHHVIIMSSRHNSFLLYFWFRDLNLFFFADGSNFNSYRNIKHVRFHRQAHLAF